MKKYILPLVVFLLISANAKADQWMTSFEDARKIAIATNKFILVDFWATWCGPCKMMDSESWSDPEIKSLMDNFVALKVNVDTERYLPNKYSIRGIPDIYIIDPNGEVIFKRSSYMTKVQVKKILEKYSFNTKLFSEDYISFFKKKKGITALKIAEKYFDYSIYVEDDIKFDFINLANIYLKKSEDLFDDEGNKNQETQRIDLLGDVYRNILRGKTEKALKTLAKKFKEDKIEERNKALYDFLYFTTYSKLKDSENAKLWYGKLKTHEGYKLMMLKSRKI